MSSARSSWYPASFRDYSSRSCDLCSYTEDSRRASSADIAWSNTRLHVDDMVGDPTGTSSEGSLGAMACCLEHHDGLVGKGILIWPSSPRAMVACYREG